MHRNIDCILEFLKNTLDGEHRLHVWPGPHVSPELDDERVDAGVGAAGHEVKEGDAMVGAGPIGGVL